MKSLGVRSSIFLYFSSWLLNKKRIPQRRMADGWLLSTNPQILQELREPTFAVTTQIVDVQK